MIAEEDMDEWVRVAANIVRDYPQQFVLDQRLGKVTTHFQETVHEIVSDSESTCVYYNGRIHA